MEWLSDALSELNYWSVLLAAASTMVVGAIWYAQSTFGTRWMKEVGLKKKDVENSEGMAQMFIVTFIFSFAAAMGLGALMITTGSTEWLDAMLLGAMVGLVFTAFPIAVNNMFGRASTTLSAIQGGEVVVRMSVMGLILGLMA
jgi:hypothetical protein